MWRATESDWEASVSIKASEVADWLRQVGGKRNHRKLVPDDDYLVIRSGPNFDWLMGNSAAGQPTPSGPEQDLAGEDRREADNRTERG